MDANEAARLSATRNPLAKTRFCPLNMDHLEFAVDRNGHAIRGRYFRTSFGVRAKTLLPSGCVGVGQNYGPSPGRDTKCTRPCSGERSGSNRSIGKTAMIASTATAPRDGRSDRPPRHYAADLHLPFMRIGSPRHPRLEPGFEMAGRFLPDCAKDAQRWAARCSSTPPMRRKPAWSWFAATASKNSISKALRASN